MDANDGIHLQRRNERRRSKPASWSAPARAVNSKASRETPVGARQWPLHGRRLEFAGSDSALQQRRATKATPCAESCENPSPQQLVHRSARRLVLRPPVCLVRLRWHFGERSRCGSPHGVPQLRHLWRCIYRSNGELHCLSLEWGFGTGRNHTAQSDWAVLLCC
jgi:hypothetical protein